LNDVIILKAIKLTTLQLKIINNYKKIINNYW